MTPLERALQLASLALDLARVDRVTLHQDGRTRESDTDHTVMLGWVACELAPAGLDRGRIAQIALVHEAAEALVGDTNTLIADDAGRAAKAAREAAAIATLRDRFGEGSWLLVHLEDYESGGSPEARWVRVIDKVLTRLTNSLNGCASARRYVDRDAFVAHHREQLARLRESYPDMEAAFQVFRAAAELSVEAWDSAVARTAPGPRCGLSGPCYTPCTYADCDLELGGGCVLRGPPA